MRRPRYSRHCLTLVTAIVALRLISATGATAAPATTTDVEKLIKRGNELRTSGKDQQALPLYQKAYELAPTPRTSAQLGLCEMALNYWMAADGHLMEALAGQGDWIDKNRSTIEVALRQVHKQIGEVVVAGSPSGAAVSIGGKQVGTLPLSPIRVAAGQLRVDVSAPGYRDRSETVVVVGDAKEQVTIDLLREGAPVESNLSSRVPAKPSGGVPPTSASSATDAVPWSTSKIAGAATVVGGGLLVLGGAGLLLIDKHERCDAPSGGMCKERTQTRRPGWGLIGAGAAAILVGGIIVYNSSSAEVAVGVSPSSIVLAGRF